jgi:cytochrome P450
VEAVANRLLDALPVGDDFDIVEALSVPFPLQVIAEILGADVDEWPTFFRWSEAAIPDVLDLSPEERGAIQLEMWNYLIGLAEDRRRDPRDDLVSAIATATIDGDLLSETELAMFLIQLLVAGNETTRNLLSGGLVALADRPQAWSHVVHDDTVIATAVDEMLRWTTPVTSFLRTATGSTSLGGHAISEGDPVLLVYASANFDEAVFGPTADQFEVTRSPNPHVSFGVGNHFCLGAALARMEADVILRGLRQRATVLTRTGDVERSPSSIISGVRHATIRLSN